MKQVTLRVDAEKYDSLLEAAKGLGAEIVEKKAPKKPRKRLSAEEKLTPGQRKTWALIKEGFEELKLIEEGKKQARPIEELFEELRKEGLYP